MEVYDWKYLNPVLGVEDLSNFDISNIFHITAALFILSIWQNWSLIPFNLVNNNLNEKFDRNN